MRPRLSPRRAAAAALGSAILVPVSLSGGSTGPAHAASASASASAKMRHCVNAERRRLDLRPLRRSAILNRAARLHARAMAAGRSPFRHEDALGRRADERVSRYTKAFTTTGENIAAGQRNAAAACRSWRRSRGHRANWTYRRYSAIGTASASGPRGRMYVQVFAGR